MERVKIGISNSVHSLIVVNISVRIIVYLQMGRLNSHVTSYVSVMSDNISEVVRHRDVVTTIPLIGSDNMAYRITSLLMCPSRSLKAI